MKVFLFSLVSVLLMLILFLLIYVISFVTTLVEEEKGGPFECGFQPFSSLGMTFSMPFFIISLMFLLFDVEILLICFFPLLAELEVFVSILTQLIIFVVLFSTLYEWSKGILSWVFSSYN